MLANILDEVLAPAVMTNVLALRMVVEVPAMAKVMEILVFQQQWRFFWPSGGNDGSGNRQLCWRYHWPSMR